MARRKSKFIEDEDDSDMSDELQDDADDAHDPNDLDEAAAAELFHDPYQKRRKRTREDALEDATYGIWGQPQDRGQGRDRGRGRGGARAGARTDFTKAPAFVSAGASSSKAPSGPVDNLAPNLQLEPAKDDEEDIAMELDSDDDDSAADERRGRDEQDEADREDSDAEADHSAQEDLAPVPGLAQSPAPEPVNERIEPEPAPLAFAPRGLGSGRGRGGGGIGSRAGIGGGGAGIGSRSAATSSGSMPIFASATSASTMPLGGNGSPAATTSDPTGTQSPMEGASTPRAGLGAGIGAGKAQTGGIGARPSLADSLRQRLAAQQATVQEPTAPSVDSSPSSSARMSPEPTQLEQPSRERRSFLPTGTASSAAPQVPKKISKKEQQHFAKLESSGSLGLRMLQKMGYKTGTGLGANEQGIVTPIGEGQKVRERGKGISSGERSAGALAEAARMRGEDPDDIEENEKKAKKAARSQQQIKEKPAGDAWKQPRRKEAKTKTEYKTYEQIVAESGAEPEGVGMLVDLSGNALPSQSLSSLPAFGSADTSRLPELRHNLTLLTSTLSASLSSLAREGKGVEERRAYLIHEDDRVRNIVEKQERAVSRLQEVMAVVARIKGIEQNVNNLLSADDSSNLTPHDLLGPFADEFDELLGRYPDEYKDLSLDEVVVGAVAPICRRILRDWDPLANPTFAVAELKRFRRHFLIDKDVVKQSNGMELDVFGSASTTNGGSSKKASDRAMTAYETMMWTIWLPRVRSAINNAWSPANPTAAVTLYTAWQPLLPLFLRDNMMDQLILPKVSKAIHDWSPTSARRGGASLHTIVFPWLEHAGDRMEIVLDEAKRKVRAWLKSWKVSDGVPADLEVWQDAFPTADWDALILKHVLPQLGSTLRESFVVNPRQQDLKPLEDVVAWSPLIRSSMMSQLIEVGFFPKWMDALYLWLTSEPNLEQVAEWYSWWKSWFPEEVVGLSGVARGFRKGLDLMNQAMALGDDAKYRLKKPEYAPSASKSASGTGRSSKTKLPSATTQAPAELDDVSFRSVVEDMAAEANLMFLATGKAHEKGYALFRVSQTIDGKSGVTVYLNDDVVWLQEKGEFKPVSVEEMVRRALAK